MSVEPQGLKDHEIAQITNALRDRLQEFVPHQCLRTVISDTLVSELKRLDRKIDR